MTDRTELSSLYRNDYSAWARRTADLLRGGRYLELDVEHLLEELSDMGRSERRELQSRLLVLLAHLLKWEYQQRLLSARWQEFEGRSWRSTIVEQRKQLAVLLRQTPGLKALIADAIAETYPDAVDLASRETGLPPETFPPSCPYPPDQLLDQDFLPPPAYPG